MQTRNSELLNLLGFSKAERKVWQHLAEKGQTIAELTFVTSLPRMTVHKVIHRFLERDLVRRIKQAKRYRYLKVPSTDLAVTINQQLGVSSGTEQIAINQRIHIKAHRGIPAMLTLIDALATEKQARWSLMQSSENAALLLQKVAREKIEALNRKIAKNQQITDLYIEEDYFEQIAKKYSSSERAAWLKSVERMAVIYLLPKYTLTAKTDLVIQSGKAYLFDWHTEVMFEINHTETVRMYQNFLAMLASTVPRTKNMYHLMEQYREKWSLEEHAS